MKVLYINLDKDTERRNFMEHQLTALGFEYERVTAVDGRLLSQVEVDSAYDSELSIKYNKKDLTRGELGCALSHKKCHELALGYDYTLILEDDIELPENFKEIVEKQIVKNIKKKKWDYLQFDYPEVGLIFIKRWMASTALYMRLHLSNSNISRKIFYIFYSSVKFFYIILISIFEGLRNTIRTKFKISKSVVFCRPLYLAGCYVLTNKAAEKILLLETKIVFAADRVHNQARRRRLMYRAYSPLMVRQKWWDFGSSILGNKSSYYTKNNINI